MDHDRRRPGHALVRRQESLVPVWLALIVAASGYVLIRWIVPADAPIAAARGIVAGGGVIVIYIGIAILPQVGWDFSWPLWFWQDWQVGRHAMVGGVMLGVFWWRGAHLGQEIVWVNSLAQSFRIGVVVVVVGVVVDVLLEAYAGTPIPTFLFFGTGIASFALIHITSMMRSRAPASGTGPALWRSPSAASSLAASFSPSWLKGNLAESRASRLSLSRVSSFRCWS